MDDDYAPVFAGCVVRYLEQDGELHEERHYDGKGRLRRSVEPGHSVVVVDWEAWCPVLRRETSADGMMRTTETRCDRRGWPVETEFEGVARGQVLLADHHRLENEHGDAGPTRIEDYATNSAFDGELALQRDLLWRGDHLVREAYHSFDQSGQPDDSWFREWDWSSDRIEVFRQGNLDDGAETVTTEARWHYDELGRLTANGVLAWQYEGDGLRPVSVHPGGAIPPMTIEYACD